MRRVKFIAASGIVAAAAWLWFGSLRVESGQERAGLARGGPSPATITSDAEAVAMHDPAPRDRRETLGATDVTPEVAVADHGVVRVTGRVVDADGQPVAQGVVHLGYEDDWRRIALDVESTSKAEEERPRWQTTTDADGRFQHRGLEPGRARLRVVADGFEPLVVGRIELTGSGAVDLSNLLLHPGLVLAGRVIDEAGDGVAGARLSRVDEGSGIISRGPYYAAVGTTDSAGGFRIGALKPGSWCIRVDSEEHPVAWFEGGEFEAGVSTGHEFRLSVASSIDGWLEIPGVTDYSRYGVYLCLVDRAADIADEHIPGRSQLVECAPDGRFEARRLLAPEPSARYEIEARDLAGGQLSVAGERIKVRAGDQDVRLTAEAPAMLAFELRDGSVALEGPVVSFDRRAGRGVNLTERGWVHRTGPGQFSVEGLPRPSQLGRYSIRVRVDGYRNYIRGDLGLMPGEKRDLGVIQLQPAMMQRVRVVDALTRGPVEGAEVRRHVRGIRNSSQLLNSSSGFQHDEAGVTATTGIEGVALVAVASGHQNYFVVDHPGYAATVSGSIGAGDAGSEPPAIDVELRRGATVHVRLRDRAGSPVSGAWVTCNSVAWEALLGSPKPRIEKPRVGAYSDGAGYVTFEHRPMGKTEIVWMPAIGAREHRSVDVVADVEYEVAINTVGITNLDVIVRAAGVPLVDAGLTLSPADLDQEVESSSYTYTTDGKRKPFVRSETDARGHGRFDGIEPGWYELVVSHPTRAFDTAREIQVRLGGEPVEVDLAVSTASGRVLASDGASCADTPVYAIRAEDDAGPALAMVIMSAQYGFEMPARLGRVSRTDETGGFEFRGLPFGAAFRVVAVPARFQVVLTAPFSVDEGATLALPDLIPAPAGQLEITVANAMGPCAVELDLLGEADALLRARMAYVLEGTVIEYHLAPGTWRARLVRGRPDPGGGGTQYSDESTIVVRVGETARVRLEYAP